MRRLAALGLVATGLWWAGCTGTGSSGGSESANASTGGAGSGGSSGQASSGGSSGASTSGSSGASGTSSSGGATSSGSISSGGSSSSQGCEDECSDSEQVCDGTDAFRLCGQFDADSCLELSQRVACPASYQCTGGQCVAPCQDECPSAGTTLCQGTSNVLTCGNFDADACLEAGGAVPCATDSHCEAGACVPDTAACTDECTVDGNVSCFGNARRSCGQFDMDTCLDLGPPVACAQSELCQNGACVPSCQNECPLNGVRECSGAGLRTCGNFDADTCLEWSTVTACASGTFCDQGNCVQTCTDACTTSGAVVCTTDNSGTQTCGDFDSDTCLDLSTAVPCPADHACSNGACIPTCADECQLTDVPRCAASGDAVERCGNYDADGCLEWGGSQACTGGAACLAGACAIPCTDDCTTGALECSGNGTRTCGQFDLDACLDWSAVSACQSFEACTAGVCGLGPTPDTIVLNEIVYDSAGGDTAAGTTTVFVELFGPAGASLDGWEVVGVNGNGGGDYKRIVLDGQSMGADGYFIIAYPNGAPAVLAIVDMTSTSVDYENGPDNVQLRWRTRTVDALGYGTFTGSAVFAGEGNAAATASSGQSLSRNAAHADTQDNAADFSVQTPSPRGNPVACTNECASNGLTQCSGTQIQRCGNFDADSCLEWDTPSACPTAGETCSGGVCAAGCTSECSSVGATQCSGQQVQTCGNFDADACLEWGTAVNCPNGGEVCSNGACSVPCTNECPTAGATQCSGSQVQVCGNNDADSCLEWLAPSACPATQSCVMGSCQVANAPDVVLITPQGAVQTTQGATVRMLVDATAAPGRTITEVRFLANGVSQAVTMAAPHEFNYVVPTNAATGSTITLTAQAVDNLGVVGTSVASYLNVRNDVPVATFTAVISTATSYTVDASAVADTETPDASLEVCWDWDNNGTCDTAFSTTKIATHDVGMNPTGTYTIRMVVRDTVGQTAETTRQVTFNNILYVGGQTITTTLWYGTVIITGDVVVGAGQTLTIDAGTQVLFVRADVNGDGVGDYTLTVDGTLISNGTAANPVVFTGQNAAAKVPGGWDRIVLNGAGSSLTYTIIEYADVGIVLNTGATLTNVTVRNIRGDGLVLANADNAVLTDLTVTGAAASGLWIHSGSNPVTVTRPVITQSGNGMWVDNQSVVSITGGSMATNTNLGLQAHNATLNVQDATIENNGWTGLAYSGTASGTATRNQIRQNGREGVLIESTNAGNPTPVVTLNNIYSNAVTGSREVATETVSVSASYSCCGSSSTSAAYAPGNGSVIRRVQVNYNETDNSNNYVRGYLLNGADNSVFRTFTADFNGWVDVPVNTASVKVRVEDSGYSGTVDTISITQAQVVRYTGAADVAGDVTGGNVDVTKNYLGTWPNVLGRTFLANPQYINLQGFVGVPFDSAFSTGPYKSGAQATQTWSGTVYVTGNVTVAAGNTVTVAAGTQVQFVGHDQDGNGVGDFSITATGALNATGASGNPVRFMGYGGPAAPAYGAINLNGTAANASTWAQVQVEDGNRAVVLRGASSLAQVNVVAPAGDGVTLDGSGAAQLTDVTITGAGGVGLVLVNADGPALTRVTVDGSGSHGVVVSSDSDGATLSHMASRNNVGDGLAIRGGSTITVEDGTFRDNGDAGVAIQDSSPTVHYSLLTYNRGAGIRIEGSGSAVLEHNIIKFNDDAGAVVLGYSTGEPSPTLQYSNIYGNAVVGASRVTAGTSVSISASYSCCGSSATSGTYTAPAGTRLARVYVNYNETDNSNNYVRGTLLNAADNSTIRTFTADFVGWVQVPPGVTSVKVSVSDSGYSGTVDTINVTQADYVSLSTGAQSELVANTASGTTLAKFNYWTADVGNVPNLIYEPRAGSVDYTGYTGLEYPGSGANAAGPRP